MKTNKILKVMFIIILIIILTLIAFIGVYAKENGRLVNKIKQFTTASEFGVEKEYVFSLSNETKTEYYDKDGNRVLDEDVNQNAEEGTYTEKEVSLNLEEVKKVENYQLTKSIMEKRLQDLGIEEYRLTIDESTGTFVLKTSSTEQIEDMLYSIYAQGEFLLKDAETQEVLLNNNDIKEAKVGYYNAETGTNVYLNISLNKEGIEKLKNISSTYVKTTEKQDVTAEDGTVTQEDKEITKNVKLYIDGNLIVNTYFGEQIKNGQLQLTMGEATTDQEQLQNILISASSEATKLSHGAIPLIYDVKYGTNILSVYDQKSLDLFIIIAILIMTVVLLYFVTKYKDRGIMASILLVGFTALYVLIARYANITITFESLVGFIFIWVFNICFTNHILYKLKNYNESEETPKSILNKSIIKSISILIPTLIVAVVFSLFTVLGLSSFGISVFWGIILFVIYSYLFTKTLLLNFEYLLEE